MSCSRCSAIHWPHLEVFSRDHLEQIFCINKRSIWQLCEVQSAQLLQYFRMYAEFWERLLIFNSEIYGKWAASARLGCIVAKHTFRCAENYHGNWYCTNTCLEDFSQCSLNQLQKYETFHWLITPAVYDFLNGCSHGYELFYWSLAKLSQKIICN